MFFVFAVRDLQENHGREDQVQAEVKGAQRGIETLLYINPLMPNGAFNICCPRDCVSRTANEKLVTIVANRH